MYKPDDKDIDRLSRDAAEHYHAPGQPSWDALQQMLDKELPQEKEKKRRGFFFFFLLLLGISVAGTGVWYGLQISTKNKTATTTNKVRAGAPVTGTPAANTSIADNTAPATAGQASAGSTAKNEPLPATATTAAALKNKPANALAIRPEGDAGKGGKSTSLALAHTTKNDIVAKNNSLATGKGKTVVRKGQQVVSAPDAAVALTDKALKTTKTGKQQNGKLSAKQTSAMHTADNSDTDAAQNDKTIIAGNNDQPSTAKQDTVANTTAIAAIPAEPATAAPVANNNKDSVPAAKKKTKAKNDRAINIGLTAGVDASTVKFKYGQNAGYNIGITGGYQFSKHWAVYTGLIYTKKNYKLNGEDYHPPKHYWTQYVQLETVDGYCRMWEVPLQARYTFNPGSKTAFFAGAGLSSYFMKKQAYNYYYKSMGIPGSAYWTNDSSYNHVFSILSLSAGFEKKIGKNMNLQVEPYAKIPLGGVGFGNIRLSSFGVNFTVQYRHPVKR